MLKRSDLDQQQRAAIAFIGSGEDSLLCADVGTGKTVIALTAGQDAIYCGAVQRWLVLAPLLVATDTWRNEPGEWEHLRDMDVAIAAGEDEAGRIAAIESSAQFVLLNYENLDWLMELYPRKGKQDPLPFDGLICDEIDKLKDVSSNRFKAFRNRIKKFRKRVGLTGTLIPNDLTEIWGQTYMVDAGETFSSVVMSDDKRIGRSFYNWRKHFFYPTDFNQYNWAPFQDTEQQLLEHLNGLAYRLPAEGLPPVIPLKPQKLILPPSVRPLYDELEKEFFLLVQDADGRDRKVDAANSAVLQGKLQQICAGFSYVDGTKEVVWHSKARFDWLDALYGGLIYEGRQLLVFYHFNAELDELKRRFCNIPYLGTGVGNSRKLKHIADWNAGRPRIMALHPASAGHGLNLQKSGAYDIAFLTVPWSGGLYEQVCGRLARRGQTADHINVHTALNHNTVDETVFSSVGFKRSVMKGFLDKLHEQTSNP